MANITYKDAPVSETFIECLFKDIITGSYFGIPGTPGAFIKASAHSFINLGTNYVNVSVSSSLEVVETRTENVSIEIYR